MSRAIYRYVGLEPSAGEIETTQSMDPVSSIETAGMYANKMAAYNCITAELSVH